MPFPRSALPLAAFGVALCGCAGASGEYPSLAIRDAERVAGTLEPVAPAPYVPPPTPPATIDRLDALAADASAAHRAFLSEAPGARGAIEATRGSDAGAESWARAQVALAGLQAARSRAMIALADLDRLMVDAALEGGALERIVATRDTVTAQVREQDAAIDAMARGLR